MTISAWCSRALATPLADAHSGRATSPPAFSGRLGLVALARGGAPSDRPRRASARTEPGPAVLRLAYANGANDVSKGVASLVGSGVAGARTAVAWGVVCTAAGSLAAAVVSSTLVATFSGGLLAEGQGAFGAPAALAVALATFVRVLLATRLGLPVSTTHALTGAIVGVALSGWGLSSVAWGALEQKVLLPLAVSPVLAVALGAGTGWLVRWLPRPAPLAVVHRLTSGATGFARGLNDAPKIVALGLGFRVALGPAAPTWLLFVGVALAMAVGGWANGRHVLETLAERVTQLGDAEGVGANLTTAVLVGAASLLGGRRGQQRADAAETTAVLVGAASLLGLPVSITHVASAAILGGGAAGGSPVRWAVVGQIGLAWLVTLPAGALLGMLLLRVVQV